jgi:hypothetical protein
MKVKIKLNSDIEKEKLDVILMFLRFLNGELKLTKDVTLELTDTKDKKMTTGVRRKNDLMKVLCDGRMLVDILRTVGHEWVHEHQHQKQGVKDSDKHPDIGGWVEDDANSISGALVKKFSKKHKELEDILY